MKINVKIAAVLSAAAVLTFAACAAFSAPAQQTQQVKKTQSTLTAEDIQYNVNTGDARAKGNVVVKRDGSTLTGSEAQGNTEQEIMTLTGSVSGDFPEKGVKMTADRAVWTGDKTKKTDGTVEAFGKVRLTKAPGDRLFADYVLWKLGTEDYKASGNVDGIMSGKALIAAEATRTGSKFWARDVKRYEDMVQKFVLSAKTVDGLLEKDAKTGQDTMKEMTADQNVVFDYVDKQNLKTRVTGDKAIYSKARGTIVVSGNAKAVRSDGKMVTADTMVMHEDTRNIEAKGNSKITYIVEEKAKKEEPAAATSGKKKTKKGTAPAAAPTEKTSKTETAAASNDAAETSKDRQPVKPDKSSQISGSEKNWVEEQ